MVMVFIALVIAFFSIGIVFLGYFYSYLDNHNNDILDMFYESHQEIKNEIRAVRDRIDSIVR